jgi:L,D-transpeptidase YcbB
MQTQDATLESGFDNTSRNVKLPKKTLATLLPPTAQTTEASIVSCEAIVAMGG